MSRKDAPTKVGRGRRGDRGTRLFLLLCGELFRFVAKANFLFPTRPVTPWNFDYPSAEIETEKGRDCVCLPVADSRGGQKKIIIATGCRQKSKKPLSPLAISANVMKKGPFPLLPPFYPLTTVAKSKVMMLSLVVPFMQPPPTFPPSLRAILSLFYRPAAAVNQQSAAAAAAAAARANHPLSLYFLEALCCSMRPSPLHRLQNPTPVPSPDSHSQPLFPRGDSVRGVWKKSDNSYFS